MEEGQSFQAVGEEINYSVENILNSSRKVSKILPLSSKSEYTFNSINGGTEDITFEIPSQPFAMKDMYIGYEITTSNALGNATNRLALHTVLPASQIYFGTQQRENEFFSLSNSMVRTQKMTQLLNKWNWKQNAQIVPDANVSNEAGGLIAKYMNITVPNTTEEYAVTNLDINDYQRAIRRINPDADDRKIKIYARLGDIFPMSCFNCSKVLQLGELSRLRLVMNFNNVFWVEDVNGALLATPNFDIRVKNLALYVKFEKNTEVVRKLNQVVSSPEGLTVPIIYPYVNTQNIAQSTTQASSFDLTSGQGMRLLSVQSAVFTPQTNARDGVVAPATNVVSHNIDINNSNIYNFDHTIDENYSYNRKILDNTPVQSKQHLAQKYFIYQDFTNGEGSRYLECEESQLDESKLVGLPLEKTSYLKYQLRATTQNLALEHQHVIYCLRFLNIRESGVSVY